MVGARQEDRRQSVEGQHAVRFRIDDLLVLRCRLERGGVGLAVLQRAEGRDAEQRVQPHVEATEANADDGAETRPQRLDVANLLQVLADVGAAPGFFIRGQFVIGPAGGDGFRDVLGRQHAGQDGVVRTLDARHVDEAGRAAHQHAAGEGHLRHRLPAALGDGARAIADALGSGEGRRDRRMRLETLEFLERRQIRVLVVQVHDEADRNLIVFQVIEEGAAAGLHVERPAEGMLDEAELVVLRLDLPEFLQADAELGGLAAFGEVVFGDELLGERAARAFADQHIFAHQRHAGREVRAMRTVFLDAHVAGVDAGDRALFVIEQPGGGEARIDFDAERLGLAGQPAADVAEGDDVVAVIVHQRRHQDVRQAEGTGRSQNQEMISRHLGLERVVALLAPAGQKAVDADRVDDGTGQDVGAGLAALFQDDNGKIGVDLLEPDRRGEPRRPRADDHHVEFHALPFDLAHQVPPHWLAVPASCWLMRSIAHHSATRNRLATTAPFRRPAKLHVGAEYLTFT